MKNRVIKLIVCIAIVSSLMVGFCTSFASAEPAWLIRAKAGIAAAMLASQLVINPVNYALDDAIAEGIDPVGYVQSIGETPWELYLEQSVIKVLPDVVTIDGVPYSDIWLGPEAAESLRLAGLDFASAYNIVNNQSEAISYASGLGYVHGIPIYSVNGVNTSQTFSGPVNTNHSAGDIVFNKYVTYNSSRDVSDYQNAITFDGHTYSESGVASGNVTEVKFAVKEYSGQYYSFWNHYPNSGATSRFNRSLGLLDSGPFSFDYTSGVIDAPLAQDDGLLLRVPSTYTDPESPSTVIYDIHDLVNLYPTITQPGGHEIEIDPNLNPDFQTDIDLGNGIGDIIRTILQVLDILTNVDIEFSPEPESPEPPPDPGTIDPLPDPDPAPDEPISGTTIANTDWTKLDEILRWIQSTIDSIRHITESLQTMLDSLFYQLQAIIQAIQSLPEQLLEDIETGPSKVFRKALDVLKSLFLPLLLPIKAMMGLWHYVVEWLTSINTPFLWIFGVLSGTSSNMVLPIYAVIAGSICIAIYKALGR